MTIYSLDVLLFLFGTSLLFHVQSNCCFLTCIQVSQEAGQVVWYSHLFQNFPQFTVIHTVEGFGIVNKAKIDVFLGCNGLRRSAEAWPWRGTPRPRSGVATESARLRQRRSGGREELPHLRREGRWPRGATPPPRSCRCRAQEA